ncbi:MAG: esterase-like activity of phytase family protein [Bdellovibrionota bacterium]
MKFNLVLTSLLFALPLIAAPKFTLKKVWQIPAQSKLENFTIGGLSGCSKLNDEMYFVSDDRGNQGHPRILVLKFDSNKSELNTTEQKWLRVAKPVDNQTFLDMEGLARLTADRILISSEGDLNQKPRQPVSLFWINSSGQRISDVTLPNKFIANPSGLQTRGTQNNMGFEGLSIDADLGLWGAILEGPLVQDRSKLIMIEGSASSGTSVQNEWSYPIPQFIGDGLGAIMGVTDFVYDKANSLIVIERGVSVGLSGMQFDVQMCTAEKDSATKSIKKNCFYDFAKDKALKAQVKEVLNYEGICWLNDQKTQFIVINDNNFSKTENNLFLLYQID